MQTAELDRIYEFGDVYETIDTCDELAMKLSRLKRQRILDEQEWQETKERVEEIRSQIAGHIPD